MTTPAGEETGTEPIIAGRYELVRPLGQGSFGRTFLARDRAAQRMVAVKMLDPRGGTDWRGHELFEREASVLRALRHHGIYDSVIISTS